MRPIRTRKTIGIYGAPIGQEDSIGGLPFWRAQNEYGGTTVYSVWTFDENDRRAIAQGANLVLGIVGMEPIPPVSLSLRGGDDEWFREVDLNPDAWDVVSDQQVERERREGLGLPPEPSSVDSRPPKPPRPPADREMG